MVAIKVEDGKNKTTTLFAEALEKVNFYLLSKLQNFNNQHVKSKCSQVSPYQDVILEPPKGFTRGGGISRTVLTVATGLFSEILMCIQISQLYLIPVRVDYPQELNILEDSRLFGMQAVG